MSSIAPFTLRPAELRDVGPIVELIRELAQFEKLEHLMQATPEKLRPQLFGEKAAAEALVVEVRNETSGARDATVVAFALFKNFAAIMGDSIAFWKDLYAHPDYDAWWKARNPRNFVTNIKPAMLVVGGLFDAEDCFGAWNLYKAIEEKSKNTDNRLVMGPWFHGGWGGRSDGSYMGNIRFGSKTAEYYQQHIEIPFFNFYLKLQGTVHDIAEANIFFTGENEWKQLKQWPPAEVISREVYLQENGMLSWNRPGGANSFTEYVSDPAHQIGRAHV